MNSMELLTDALDYMECHLHEEIKTEDVAKACFCSKSTLEKLFRCVNHISMRDYLIRRRMTKAARMLLEQPQRNILDIALQYGYGSNEAFSRAFKQVWNCKPSEFRSRNEGEAYRFSELFPRLYEPMENGDKYMSERRHVDISELYDLFVTRKDCYFVCCDIKSLVPINEIARKAGDLAILETLHRMQEAAGEEDFVFRIGGDEFALLTDSADINYAEQIAEKIREKNGQPFVYEEKQLPLSLHVGVARMEKSRVRYNELFTGLHNAIIESK